MSTSVTKETAGTARKATAPSETINEISHEAMRSYEKALKSGIELQEESVKTWKELISRLGSPEAFQAKVESFSADVFPNARKHMDEFVEAFSQKSNQTLDLFQKSLSVYQATSVSDAQSRLQDVIESSLAALRLNIHTVLNTNARIVNSWKELVDRLVPATR